jgi:hypothetical protein
MCAKRHTSLWGSRLRIEPFHTTGRVKQLRWIGSYTAPCVFPFAIATSITPTTNIFLINIRLCQYACETARRSMVFTPHNRSGWFSGPRCCRPHFKPRSRSWNGPSTNYRLFFRPSTKCRLLFWILTNCRLTFWTSDQLSTIVEIWNLGQLSTLVEFYQ